MKETKASQMSLPNCTESGKEEYTEELESTTNFITSSQNNFLQEAFSKTTAIKT